MDRPRAEEQRCAPVAEEGDVGGVGDRRRPEAGHGVEMLRGDERTVLELGAPVGPGIERRLHRGDIADQADHHLRLAGAGDDVRLGTAADQADVHGGRTKDRVDGQRKRVELRQHPQHGRDRRLAEVCVGRMRFAAPRAHDHALRTLAPRGQHALGRLTVDEPAARGRQLIRESCAVGAALLTHDEQEVDALLARARQRVGGDHHRGGDALGVARAAPIESAVGTLGRNVRWDGIEVGGERHTASLPRGPHVAASRGHLLHHHVPVARDEPAGHEIDCAPFVACGRGDREEFGSQSDDVGHAFKLTRSRGPIPRLPHAPAPPNVRLMRE